MNELDRKINEQFPGMVVRKDLVKQVKGNAIVPSYVLEYLLGQYCATSDEASIQSGVETVKEILRQHYVHRSEAGLVRSTIRERGRHKVIDKVSADLNEKRDVYEATFANLGIRQVLVDVDTIKRNPKLLVSGVWCIADLEYQFYEEGDAVPWILESLKPIQLSRFDFEQYLEARRAFTTDEWIDLLMQSIGFNPALFGRRSKLLQLVRLVPYCERNYNLIELGPKGTGKSHIYTEFSPHGILISGGEVTVPKLFVNNATGRIGLVGFWDVVAFDEFAGRKRVDKALVDILKNYMANKSFSRGIETLGAEASMAFVGNTQHTLPYMLRHSDLFVPLPDKYYDSAFLDRLHFYVPGWEIDIIRSEMFSDGYGFVVDYLAEILRHLRDYDYSHYYADHLRLMSDLSTRDRTGIQKTFSGLMKLIYPHQEATHEEIEEILRFAIEGRKRVKDQLMRIDPTYAEVDFAYTDVESGQVRRVQTLEEKTYPRYYGAGGDEDAGEDILADWEAASPGGEDERQAQHLTFEENERGVSFDGLFGPYLKGAGEIVVTDPYIRLFFQARNLMELLETVARVKETGEEVSVHLVTVRDEFGEEQQEEYLQQMQAAAATAGVHFTWEYDETGALHARHIVTDTGWKILLDRGLDIFQRYEMNDAFALANRVQEQRAVKAFEVTYLRVDGA
ncbi:MAG TPA: BREX system Lon protease-like protein BrxL [Chloroflexi bacterium]|nr:BREX system Lon protease-like protein BrxL [Chloroflexota bacterium]